MGDSVPKIRLRDGLPLRGNFVTLAEVTPEDTPELYKNYGLPGSTDVFEYLPGNPPKSEDEFREEFKDKKDDLVFLSVKADPKRLNFQSENSADSAAASDTHTSVLGLVAYQINDAENLCFEVGAILGPALQRTVAATEANYLQLRYVFDTLGAHRVAWKMNAMNEKSRRAAQRMGFVYEGRIREGRIWKGKRVDGEFLGMLKSEWQASKGGFEAWLDRANFDESGRQKATLEMLRK